MGVTAKHGFRGGLDVSLPGTDVPYLFKVGDGDSNLHMCCPMSSPLRPRTFDGPGYVSMSRGREGSDANASKNATEGEQVSQYLDELAALVELQDRMTSGRGDGAAMAECLEEDRAVGDIVRSSELSAGPQTLDDKKNMMESQQRMAALRVKYSPSIMETAQRLINGELKASDVHPSDPWPLEKRLRSFQRRRAEDADEEETEAAPASDHRAADAPAASFAAGDSTVAATSDAAVTRNVAVAPAPVDVQTERRPAPTARPEPQAERTPAPASSCWSGCFPGGAQSKRAVKTA